jgi:hypothetical protein
MRARPRACHARCRRAGRGAPRAPARGRAPWLRYGGRHVAAARARTEASTTSRRLHIGAGPSGRGRAGSWSWLVSGEQVAPRASRPSRGLQRGGGEEGGGGSPRAGYRGCSLRSLRSLRPIMPRIIGSRALWPAGRRRWWWRRGVRSAGGHAACTSASSSAGRAPALDHHVSRAASSWAAPARNNKLFHPARPRACGLGLVSRPRPTNSRSAEALARRAPQRSSFKRFAVRGESRAVRDGEGGADGPPSQPLRSRAALARPWRCVKLAASLAPGPG